MKADDAKRLRELERENARLKRIVADKELEIDALQDGVARLLAWPPPLGLPPGLGDLARGGLDRESQASATALA